MHEFKVEGMTCGSCANAINRAIKNRDAQAETTVDLSAQTVKVKSDTTAQDLVVAIEQAGFPVLASRETPS